jgi:hypothetical protein
MTDEEIYREVEKRLGLLRESFTRFEVEAQQAIDEAEFASTQQEWRGHVEHNRKRIREAERWLLENPYHRPEISELPE